MARRIVPKHKICRKYGEKLCDSVKCPLTKRAYPAGQHGQSQKRAKVSGYGKQLMEKQKVKKIYGILERQFSNYVEEASRKVGDTSKILLNFLESRLDNVVYRMGLAPSRTSARQMVTHGHITVNGEKVDIPSYRVKVGQAIAASKKAQGKKLLEGISEKLQKVEAPAWLSVDAKAVGGKVLNAPTVENPNFNPKAIIEFYSR
ncbi:MAG: 30S ribosomal protein S4 [Candidatus Magasanikbacteria bacterium]|nr:30S ribosomal protein S4 [Candidatus Magasanikbacteria bacterium]